MVVQPLCAPCLCFPPTFLKTRRFGILQHHIGCCGDDCDVANRDMTSLTTSEEGQKHKDAVWLLFFSCCPLPNNPALPFPVLPCAASWPSADAQISSFLKSCMATYQEPLGCISAGRIDQKYVHREICLLYSGKIKVISYPSDPKEKWHVGGRRGETTGQGGEPLLLMLLMLSVWPKSKPCSLPCC